jgi:hypothetical protein
VPGPDNFGRWLMIFGAILMVAGLIVVVASRLFNLGHLKGDIIIRRGNFTFYFPLMSCLVLSLILTLILWIFRRH